MGRFKCLDITASCNASAKDTMAGSEGKPGWTEHMAERLRDLPGADQVFWGIPFSAVNTDDSLRLVTFSQDKGGCTIPLSGTATHICLLHGADFPEDYSTNAAGGYEVARYVVRYADGREHIQPIRMRFEINCPCDWGRYAFAAKPADNIIDISKDDKNYEWGYVQTGVWGGGSWATLWVYAIELPDTASELESLSIQPVSGRAAVAAVTLYDGPGHPLRHVPRHVYKLVLPEPMKPNQVKTGIDLGFITRTYAVPGHIDDSWLTDENAGLGTPWADAEPTREFLVEATGSLGATITVNDETEQRHEIELGKAFTDGKTVSTDGGVKVEMLDGRKTWVHVTVVDTATGRPTPTRVQFLGTHGEYIPPYGHHQEVNDRWFQDYAGDLKLGTSSYAYVPGEFQIELPEGEVYVEIAKGFEYAPVRQKLHIRDGQRDLKLGISRWSDLRSSNWVTADTHVHFISPDTAWLEGQAEGLNLINLLASQWGKLFTNVADISGSQAGCSRDDTLVWVGTENRHHLLGHISMLGTQGNPVFPMCGGGPGEAWFGDPDYMLLTEWAEMCKKREGVVIRPHFPSPICEEPVYMMLEQLDGVELRHLGDPSSGSLDTGSYKEWYRYLNCGCRVAAVGGTDKMSAGMPVGGVRTYAKLDPDDEFNFANWGKAVRAGRTFTSSGAIIDLRVEGRSIGDEIQLPAGGGMLEVQAEAECSWPIHRLEVVVNGRVVASTDSETGDKRLVISDKINIDGSCWIAARCSSRTQVHHCWTAQVGAHTSPVYVVVGKQEVFNAEDATYMLTLIDGGLTYLETLSIRYSEDKHLAQKALFEHARRVIHHKMHEHGITH